jgi:hypothetical protein
MALQRKVFAEWKHRNTAKWSVSQKYYELEEAEPKVLIQFTQLEINFKSSFRGTTNFLSNDTT